jgi:hypothetical protein
MLRVRALRLIAFPERENGVIACPWIDDYIIPTPPQNATSGMIVTADGLSDFCGRKGWSGGANQKLKHTKNYRAAGTGVFLDFGRRFVVGVPAAFLIGANAVDRRRTRLVTS